jgi:hypothetical protein
MDVKYKLLTVSLLVSLVSACSGSGGKNIRSSSGNEPDPPKEMASSTFVEKTVEDSSDVTGEVGKTIEVLGATISQTELPVLGTVTDGAGNVVSSIGEGVTDLSSGLDNGVGNISENDNALGTTIAGATGLVSKTGNVVSETGTIVASLETLPVLAQLDEASGVLTTVGGTLDSLSLKVTSIGDYLTLAFVGEGGAASSLTQNLTAVVRPLIINVDGVIKNVGQAIVITPAVTGLIENVGSGVVVLGESFDKQDNIVLASAGGVVKGVGQLLVQVDGNLAIDAEESDAVGLSAFALTGLLADNDSGDLLNQLLDNGLSLGETSLLAELINQDQPLLASLTQVLDGLTGGSLGLLGSNGDGLLNTVGGVTGSLTGGGVLNTVGGVTGGLTGSEGDGLVGGVLNTVGGVTDGGLIGSEGDGIVGGVLNTVGGVTDGGLTGSEGDGLVGGVLNTVGGVTDGGLTGTESDGLVDGVLNTVGGVTGGLTGSEDTGLVGGALGDLINR